MFHINNNGNKNIQFIPLRKKIYIITKARRAKYQLRFEHFHV